MRHTPPGRDFRRPTDWRRNQALGPFAAFTDTRKTLAASKTERTPGARRGRRAYRRSLARRTREKGVLVKAALRRFPDVRRKNPVRAAGEQDPHVSQAREGEGSGIAFRMWAEDAALHAREGSGSNFPDMRKRPCKQRRFRALPTPANTKIARRKQKTEANYASCGGFVKPSGADKCSRKPLSGRVPRWIYQPLRDCRMQPPGGNPCKRNFLDALPTPVRSSNAVAKLHSSCQAEFPRCICETQRGRQMQSQTLIMRSSPVDLPNPVGLSNAVAKWNFSPGSGVSSVNSQTPTGLSNAAARWNLSPGGEDFSVHLPRTAGSSNAVARRQPSPSGVPRWIYQTLQDCRIQSRGGKPCWAEVPRCICESQRDRQMQPPGRTSRQAAESPR